MQDGTGVSFRQPPPPRSLSPSPIPIPHPPPPIQRRHPLQRRRSWRRLPSTRGRQRPAAALHPTPRREDAVAWSCAASSIPCSVHPHGRLGFLAPPPLAPASLLPPPCTATSTVDHKHNPAHPPPGPLPHRRRIRSDAAAPHSKNRFLGSVATQKEVATPLCSRGGSHHSLGRVQEGATRLRSGARDQVLRRARCDAGYCASTAATAAPTTARSRRAAQGHELHPEPITPILRSDQWGSLQDNFQKRSGHPPRSIAATPQGASITSSGAATREWTRQRHLAEDARSEEGARCRP